MSIRRSPTRQVVGSACWNTLPEPSAMRTVYSYIPGASSRLDSIQAQYTQRTACAVASSTGSSGAMCACAGVHAWSAVPAALKTVTTAARAKSRGQSQAATCNFMGRLSPPDNRKSVRQRTYPAICAGVTSYNAGWKRPRTTLTRSPGFQDGDVLDCNTRTEPSCRRTPVSYSVAGPFGIGFPLSTPRKTAMLSTAPPLTVLPWCLAGARCTSWTSSTTPQVLHARMPPVDTALADGSSAAAMRSITGETPALNATAASATSRIWQPDSSSRLRPRWVGSAARNGGCF